VLTTNEKGTVTEMAIAHEAARLGIGVSPRIRHRSRALARSVQVGSTAALDGSCD